MATFLPSQEIIDQIVLANFIDTFWNWHKLYWWITYIGCIDPKGQMPVAEIIATRPVFEDK